MIPLMIFCLSQAFSLPQRLPERDIAEFYEISQQQGVKVKYYEGKGLGLEVQKDLNPGDFVICTKKHQKITPNDEYELSKYTSNLDEYSKLRVRILYHKFMSNQSDFFTTYVKTLPDTYFHYQQINQSHKDLLANLTLMDFEYEGLDSEARYNEIKSALKDAEGVPDEMLKFESYMWAHFIVRSRNYAYYTNGTKINVLIPILDLGNHYPNPLNYRDDWFLNTSQAEDCLVTFWPLSKGDEFVYQYSTHNSITFFLGYNIILPNSPYDYVAYEYKGPISFGDQDEKYFRLYGYMINVKLFKILSMISGCSFELKGSIRETWELSDNSDHYSIIDTLLLYKIFILRFFSMWNVGLRDLRRNYKGFDYFSSRIIEFGITHRITAFNHLRALDQDILYALHSKLLKIR